MRIYEAELKIIAELHAPSPEEARQRRERLDETITRVLSASPALHALGALHIRVELLPAFGEKPGQGRPLVELREADAHLAPTGVDPGRRYPHGEVLGEPDDRDATGTREHYPEGSDNAASVLTDTDQTSAPGV
jgi:hypothetical protein